MVLQTTIRKDGETGRVLMEAPTADYKERFGSTYWMCYRADLHRALMEEVLRTDDNQSLGPPCELKQDWRLASLDAESGTCHFSNGARISADLIVGADGIHSQVRECLGIKPIMKPSQSCCYRFVIPCSRLHSLGLSHLCSSPAITFWGGTGIDKVVTGTAHNHELLTCYAFYPASRNDLQRDGWNIAASPKQLVETFQDTGLDPDVLKLMLNSEDIKMWRLFEHEPYPYWYKGRVCLLGDAAHPMMPDQNQGFSQAVEDAGALYLLSMTDRFYSSAINGDIGKALKIYEQVRMGRATIIQEKSLLARTDIRERFGFRAPDDPPDKLTLEWVCGYDMKTHLDEVLARTTA